MALKNIEFKQSFDRPAWIQDNLNAYRNKYVNGKILLDFYVRRQRNYGKKKSASKV